MVRKVTFVCKVLNDNLAVFLLKGGEKEGRDGRYFNVEPYSWTGYNSFERAESEIYRLPYPGVWTVFLRLDR